MPQRHIFKRRRDRGPNDTGEARQIFGQHGVAFVRHRRRAFLPGGEELLGLAEFGPLQMADFGRQSFDGAGNDTESREEHRMTVARNHLGRYRLRRQAHPGGDMLFDGRVDMGEGANRAGNRAGRNFVPRRNQPLAAPGKLRIERGKLQSEGCRLGMDAVASSDGRRVFMFLGAGLQGRQKPVDPLQQQIAGARHLDGKSCI